MALWAPFKQRPDPPAQPSFGTQWLRSLANLVPQAASTGLQHAIGGAIKDAFAQRAEERQHGRRMDELAQRFQNQQSLAGEQATQARMQEQRRQEAARKQQAERDRQRFYEQRSKEAYDFLPSEAARFHGEKEQYQSPVTQGTLPFLQKTLPKAAGAMMGAATMMPFGEPKEGGEPPAPWEPDPPVGQVGTTGAQGFLPTMLARKGAETMGRAAEGTPSMERSARELAISESMVPPEERMRRQQMSRHRPGSLSFQQRLQLKAADAYRDFLRQGYTEAQAKQKTKAQLMTNPVVMFNFTPQQIDEMLTGPPQEFEWQPQRFLGGGGRRRPRGKPPDRGPNRNTPKWNRAYQKYLKESGGDEKAAQRAADNVAG